MIDKLKEIVKGAAELMPRNGFDVTQKGGYENIVTSSDVAVQTYLCERLAKLLPGSGFLCEEEDMWEEGHEYTWIIDPIDGTANYSRGIGQCAICVGLKHNDEMQMAVVYLPWTNEMFSAEKGRGAYLNSTRIHVSDRTFGNAVLCTALSVYHKEHAKLCSDIILDAFMQCNDIRRFGAAAPELCYIAMGRCELYFEYLLSPWDYAAASLIVNEAGGCLCDLEGNPLTYVKPCGVLAGNTPENLERMKEIVARQSQTA